MDRYIRTMGELSVVFSALPAAEPEGELFLLRPGGAALLTALALRQFGVPCALGGKPSAARCRKGRNGYR